MRFILLYKVVFERQRVYFGRRYYIVKVGDIRHHSRDFFVFFGRVKVLFYSVFKHFRFADVYDVAVFVEHDVHARVFGQHRNFKREFFVHRLFLASLRSYILAAFLSRISLSSVVLPSITSIKILLSVLPTSSPLNPIAIKSEPFILSPE